MKAKLVKQTKLTKKDENYISKQWKKLPAKRDALLKRLFIKVLTGLNEYARIKSLGSVKQKLRGGSKKKGSNVNKIQKVSTEVQSFIAYLAIETMFIYFGVTFFGDGTTAQQVVGIILSAVAGGVAIKILTKRLQ